MVACGSGQAEVVKGLLAQGAEGSLKDHSGATSLHYAAQGGHVKCIQLLVEAAGRGGRRRGHWCEREGEEDEVVEARQDSTGSTPLHLAVTQQHTHAVAYLVQVAHARVLLRDGRGYTAIDLAASAGRTDLVAFLTHYTTPPPLHIHTHHKMPPQDTHDKHDTTQRRASMSTVTVSPCLSLCVSGQ
jgi:ankyrin repeat protein